MKTAVAPNGAPWPFARLPSWIRAYIRTIGTIEGNIIAAIITTHAVTQNPSVPGSVPGPMSIPAIRSSVTSQPIAARIRSVPIRPSLIRSGRAGARLTEAASMGFCDYRLTGVLELGSLAVIRVEGLAEEARRAGRLTDREDRREAERGVARGGRLAVRAPERLEVDVRIADLRRRLVAVREADGRALDAEPLTDQGHELAEHATLVALEDAAERVSLLVGGALVDDDAQLQVAAADVRRGHVPHGDVDAREVDVVEVPVLDPEHEQAAALTVSAGGRPVHSASADLLAVAVAH